LTTSTLSTSPTGNKSLDLNELLQSILSTEGNALFNGEDLASGYATQTAIHDLLGIDLT